MDNNILGERIREARGDLSLRDFAKICEISHTHLDSLEKGYDPRTGKKVSIGWDTLKKISAATGLPVLYIAGETDDKLDGFVVQPEENTPVTNYGDERDNILRDLIENLPEEKAEEVLRYIKYLKSQEESQ